MAEMHKIWNIDLGTDYREEELDGRKYIVVPMVMILEGVHTGSQGPVYYSIDELAKTPKMWNLKPIVIEHPFRGDTATDLEVYKRQSVGMVMNTHFIDGKLKAEAWIDIEKAKEKCPTILDHIAHRLPMEISTGLFSELVLEEGVWNGEPYKGRIINIRADHLAILPQKQGACSLSDGAGLLINQKQEIDQKEVLNVISTVINQEYVAGSNVVLDQGDEKKQHANDAKVMPQPKEPEHQDQTNNTIEGGSNVQEYVTTDGFKVTIEAPGNQKFNVPKQSNSISKTINYTENYIAENQEEEPVRDNAKIVDQTEVEEGDKDVVELLEQFYHKANKILRTKNGRSVVKNDDGDAKERLNRGQYIIEQATEGSSYVGERAKRSKRKSGTPYDLAVQRRFGVTPFMVYEGQNLNEVAQSRRMEITRLGKQLQKYKDYLTPMLEKYRGKDPDIDNCLDGLIGKGARNLYKFGEEFLDEATKDKIKFNEIPRDQAAYDFKAAYDVYNTLLPKAIERLVDLEQGNNESPAVVKLTRSLGDRCKEAGCKLVKYQAEFASWSSKYAIKMRDQAVDEDFDEHIRKMTTIADQEELRQRMRLLGISAGKTHPKFKKQLMVMSKLLNELGEPFSQYLQKDATIHFRDLWDWYWQTDNRPTQQNRLHWQSRDYAGYNSARAVLSSIKRDIDTIRGDDEAKEGKNLSALDTVGTIADNILLYMDTYIPAMQQYRDRWNQIKKSGESDAELGTRIDVSYLDELGDRSFKDIEDAGVSVHNERDTAVAVFNACFCTYYPELFGVVNDLWSLVHPFNALPAFKEDIPEDVYNDLSYMAVCLSVF